MEFNKSGYLPEGIHPMDWNSFQEAFNFSPRRKELLQGLSTVVRILKECGCEALYIDGSFVTDKLEPNDWDACFKGDRESITRLYKADADLVLDDSQKRYQQKKKYSGELYPHSVYAEGDQSYLDLFQSVKGSKNKKGIIKITLS